MTELKYDEDLTKEAIEDIVSLQTTCDIDPEIFSGILCGMMTHYAKEAGLSTKMVLKTVREAMQKDV